MKEKDFQTQIKRSFDFYCRRKKIKNKDYFKIPDLGFRNRYDCYFRLPIDRYIGCELKVNRQKDTFNFLALFGYGKTYHEIQNLKTDILIGSSAWVIILHKQSGKKQKTAYAITPERADFYYQSKKANSKLRITLEDIQRNSIELKRIHDGTELLYDLTPLFE